MVSIFLVMTILEAVIVTFVRLWYLMAISILIAIVFGILAARVKIAEMIIIPITDVLESVPVISFFPIVLVLFLVDIGGSLGIELAVDFLIITALVWNIILGVYQAVSHIPNELIEATKVFHLSLWHRLRYLYVPASIPKIVANIIPSFASGLFYITLSEVIQFGRTTYSVAGIGKVAIQIASRGDLAGEGVLFLILIIALILNFLLIINPLVKFSDKYTLEQERGEGGTVRSRGRNNITTSMTQRTSQVITSSIQAFSSLNKIVKYMPGGKLKKRLKLSERGVNLAVGLILIFILFASIYVIAKSGFSEAFILYMLNRDFLLAATVGTAYDLLRIIIVYAISLLTMIPLAIIAGSKRKKGETLNMAMQVVYSIPAPIFFPLIVVYLTPLLASRYSPDIAFNIDVLIITYLSAASYIFFNVYGATRSIPSELNMVATTLKMKRLARLRYLVIPSIIPAFITGSMSAMGSYWAGLMVGEYTSIHGKSYSVTYGLMKMIDVAIANDNVKLADAVDIYMVIVIVIISYLLWIRLYAYTKKRYTL